MDENAPPSSNVPPLPPLPPLPPSPPPVPPPPVITPTYGPQPPRRGRGWMVLAMVLLVLLLISVLYNVASGFLRGKTGGYARTVGPRLEEVLREDNESANKIAVIEVSGIITSAALDQGGFNMVDLIRAELRRAQEDSHVRAVILKVDSPGGEVMPSDEINHVIAEFQKKARKPVVASMGSLAASGGYYISAPCRWIVANDLTITGSIGVILSSWNYRGLMDKVGLLPQTYKSGRFKDMLSGSREPDQILPEEREMVQSLINETYASFTNVVQRGRSQAHELNRQDGRALSPDWASYADGRVLSGSRAYQLGFVDELGYFKDAVARAKTIAGISDANLVQYQQRFDLSELFHLFGKSESSRALKIDLGIDAPRLKAGQLYFLSPTLIH